MLCLVRYILYRHLSPGTLGLLLNKLNFIANLIVSILHIDHLLWIPADFLSNYFSFTRINKILIIRTYTKKACVTGKGRVAVTHTLYWRMSLGRLAMLLNIP